jgi:hypothetical protein
MKGGRQMKNFKKLFAIVALVAILLTGTVILNGPGTIGPPPDGLV